MLLYGNNKMRTNQFFILLSILLFFSGCTVKEVLSSSPKYLKAEDIKKLNSILKEVRDTLVIKLNKEYEEETYANLPDQMRNRLQKAIIEQGYLLRADSSYYLGVNDAIAKIRNGILVYKTYGLGRILEISGIENKWQPDIVLRYILLNKYSIKTEVIAGDMVNSSLTAYAEGYNKIFYPVVNIFYGFDVIQKAFDEIPDVIKNEGKEHIEWIY